MSPVIDFSHLRRNLQRNGSVLKDSIVDIIKGALIWWQECMEHT